MDEHILENKSWNWITPNKIAEDLPILGLKKEAIRNILKNYLGKSWNWITPNKIAEDLPILGLKKEAIRNILKNYLGIKPKNWDERFEKFSDSMNCYLVFLSILNKKYLISYIS